MFHKEDSSTASGKKKAVDVPVRKSDRRKLRDVASACLFRTSEESPSKCQMELLDHIFLQGSLVGRKLTHPQLNRVLLYFRGPSDATELDITAGDEVTRWPFTSSTQCVWLSVDLGPNQLALECPSVALLSLFPNFNSVTVHFHVSKYLCRGAHLMKAGVHALPKVMKGSLVGIKVAGNPQPFAVGRLLMSDMTEKTQSGVGVEVWTCYGDDIYKQTTASASVGVHNSNGGAPFDNGHYGNVGFLDAQLVRPIVEVGQEEEDDDCEEETKDDEELQSTDRASQTEMRGDEPTTEVDDTAAEESDAPSTAVSVVPQEPVSLSPDEILHLSMCRALVDLKDKDLPITAANLYANHVLTHRPPDATIQLKQTTYKKFGAYLVHLAEQGLINIGEDKKDQNPAGFLTSIDRSHPDLRGIKKTPSAAEAVKTKTTIVSLYSVPHHFEALLRLNPDDVKAANAKSEERKGTGLVTAQEAREILEKYCKDNELLPADAAEVTLDAALTDALYKKSKDSPPSRLSRKDLHAAWIKKMEPAYAVVLMPGSKIIKLARGTAPKVQMEVTMRQGKKFVTRLRGIEEYGIDGEYFCKDVSRRFACSGAIETEPQMGKLKKGHVEMVFQGHLVEELRALLLGDEKLCSHGGVKDSEYSLPKQSIEVALRKGVPERKRK